MQVPKRNVDAGEILQSLVSWVEREIWLWPGSPVRQPLCPLRGEDAFHSWVISPVTQSALNLLLCDPTVIWHMATHCNLGVITLP